MTSTPPLSKRASEPKRVMYCAIAGLLSRARRPHGAAHQATEPAQLRLLAARKRAHLAHDQRHVAGEQALDEPASPVDEGHGDVAVAAEQLSSDPTASGDPR